MNLILAFAILAVIGMAIVAARWAGTDGGPRRTPPPRAENEWSPDLPDHPYSR